MLAVKAPVDFEPLVATDPLQAPEAVQAVASVEDQVNVEPPPLDWGHQGPAHPQQQYHSQQDG